MRSRVRSGLLLGAGMAIVLGVPLGATALAAGVPLEEGLKPLAAFMVFFFCGGFIIGWSALSLFARDK